MPHLMQDLGSADPAPPRPAVRPPAPEPIPIGFELPRGAVAARRSLATAAGASLGRQRPRALLHPGSYRIAIRPDHGITDLHGVLRVEDRDGLVAVSADLYRYVARGILRRRPWLRGAEQPPELPPPMMSALGRPVVPLRLPEHPAERYAAHLRATAIRQRPPRHGAHRLAIAAEQHRGGCAAGLSPGMVTPQPVAVALLLEPRPHPPGYTSIHLEGTLYEGLAVVGRVSLGWVSPHVDAGAVFAQDAFRPDRGIDPASVGPTDAG
jgi:hypothetical protein